MLEKTHLDELLLFGKQGGLEGLEALGGGGVGVDHQAQVLRVVRVNTSQMMRLLRIPRG